MRTMVLSLAVLVALGVAGCSGNGSGAQQGEGAAQGGSSAPAHVASSVSGTVGLRDPKAHNLTDQAKLTIKLVDVSKRSAAPLASKTVAPVTKLPVKFSLDIKPGQIHASDLYVVQAEIVDGIRHYTMPLQAPVLTKGAASHADIRLVAVPTEGEKMFAAYKKLKAQIGGMKLDKGTSLNKKVSRGWQVFSEKTSGEVRFVIELSDYVDGGFTHVSYAYKNGKPWVVVLKKMASKNARPSEVDRAGWDISGKLVLKQKIVDGKTTTLDADTAADLHKQAKAMLAKVK